MHFWAGEAQEEQCLHLGGRQFRLFALRPQQMTNG